MHSALKRSATWVRMGGILLGVWVLAVTSGRFHSLLGFQCLVQPQWQTVRRIAQFVGLGLIGILGLGGHVDWWVGAALERFDGWILRDRKRASLLLVVLILVYMGVYCCFAFYRHYSFNSTGYDLAIQDQVVWNTAQGRLFESSIEIENYLGDHVQPYLALFSLIFLVAPSPYVLLFFQTLILALSAWPLYRLARRKFDSPAAGLIFALCILAYPPLGFLNRFDFHSEVIVVPLLIAACERMDAGDWKSASFLMAAALLVKEEIGLTVAAMGLFIAFYHKRWPLGLVWALAGLTCSLVALFVIIPAFRGEASDTLARYKWLGDRPVEMLATIVLHPGAVLRNMAKAGRRVTTLLQLLAPLAFSPLLGFLSLLPAAPALLYNSLSQGGCQATIYCHYMAPVIPFMAVSSVLGFRRVTSNRGGRRILAWLFSRPIRPGLGVGLGLSVLLLATLASWTYESPITDDSVVPTARLVQPNAAVVREGLSHVPKDAYLVTTNAYAPHLSHRRKIRILMYDQAFDPQAEAIFLNLRDLRWLMSCEGYLQYLKLAARSGFGVTFYQDGVLLIQKNGGDAVQLHKLLDNWPGCE